MLKYFRLTPKLFRQLQTLTNAEKDVYLTFCLHQDIHTCVSDAMRIQKIAKLSGIENLTYLYRALRGLKDKGAIKKCKGQKQGVHKYVLCWNEPIPKGREES